MSRNFTLNAWNQHRYTVLPRIAILISILMGVATSGCTDQGSTDPVNPVTQPKVVSVAKRDEVLVAAGEFKMGSEFGEDDEKPMHKQEVAAFYMDRKEVSNAQYRLFLADCKAGKKIDEHPDCPADKDHTPSLLSYRGSIAKHFPKDYLTNSKYNDYPVVGVDYFDAWAYAVWAGRRLPSEVEWEFAAKTEENRRYPWGDDAPLKPTVRANFFTPKRGNDFFGKDQERREKFGSNEQLPHYDGFPLLAPAGAFPDGASKAGVLNLAGNVWEWTNSRYLPYKDDPSAKNLDTLRVIRGGAWDSPSSFLFRCANRVSCESKTRRNNIGFRTVRSAKTE